MDVQVQGHTAVDLGGASVHRDERKIIEKSVLDLCEESHLDKNEISLDTVISRHIVLMVHSLGGKATKYHMQII